MRFIYSLPLGKRFIYNGDKQTEKWAVHNEVYIQSSSGETFFIQVNTQKWIHNEVYIQSIHWRNVLYIMEINKQTEKWEFIYNGDAVHNEVYIQSSIGETFYI